jgi:hypothetical protein
MAPSCEAPERKSRITGETGSAGTTRQETGQKKTASEKRAAKVYAPDAAG